MPRKKGSEKRVRLNLELPVSVRDRIERLRARTEADSLTEVIRRAVEVYEKMLNRQDAGSPAYYHDLETGKEIDLLLNPARSES